MEKYIDEKFLNTFGSKMFKEYAKIYPNAEAIPLMELMGNKTLREKFNDNPDAVYDYCLDVHKTWEDVLGYTYDPNAIY